MACFVSAEGQHFCAKHSDVIPSRVLTGLHATQGVRPPEPATTSLPSHILEKVLQFCVHYTQHPFPYMERRLALQPVKTANDLLQATSAFYVSFLDIDTNTLVALGQAALTLEIPALHQLTAYRVAVMVEGQSPADIRHMFTNIT